MTPAQFEVGIASVREGRASRTRRAFWELRYADPGIHPGTGTDTGHDVKRRVSGLERDEIRDMAENLTRRAYQGKSYLKAKATWPDSRRPRR